MSEPAKKDGTEGCLWKGCLGVILVALGLGAAFGWGAYSLYQQAWELTADHPAAVPTFTPDAEKAASFQRRLRAAASNWEQGKSATLEVTGADLNNLLDHQAALDHVVGDYFFEIQDGEIFMHTSVPLHWMEGYEGRYFNGVIGLRPKLDDGRFFLEISHLRSGELSAPPQIMETIKYFDWTAWLDRLGLRQNLDRLDSARVEGKVLILRKD